MNIIPLPHRAKVYRNRVVKKGLQEVMEMSLVYDCIECELANPGASWSNGVYQNDRDESATIRFNESACIEMGDMIEVNSKKFTVSDVNAKPLLVGLSGSIIATCKLL